jgi:hypothetical protein
MNIKTKFIKKPSRILPLASILLGVSSLLYLHSHSKSVHASSHREAPQITETPKVDGTDFYMFNSYEAGRSEYVTLIANYIPKQDAYGGPNYFTMDPDAVYDIKIENSGDAKEDITFRFKFRTFLKDITLPVGDKNVSVPLSVVGPISASDNASQNVSEFYSLAVKTGKNKKFEKIINSATNSPEFRKPLDNIGNKTIADYAAYANSFKYEISIPGCKEKGKVFVGQRKDPFVVNLGETFDLVNIKNPLGAMDAEKDDLAEKNVTSLALEVPKSCLLQAGSATIGGWTTSSLPAIKKVRKGKTIDEKLTVGRNKLVQVSRLGNPLVQPKGDAKFLTYVTNPTLPAILELLFGSVGVKAPTTFPRSDLIAVFLTGVEGVNKFGVASEMMRLNTGIPAVVAANQKTLGVIDGDSAGYPNGRRPGDDVVDISLRVAMGKLLPADQAASGQLPFTDGAALSAADFYNEFPYVTTPIPGSPNA